MDRDHIRMLQDFAQAVDARYADRLLIAARPVWIVKTHIIAERFRPQRDSGTYATAANQSEYLSTRSPASTAR